MSGIGIPPTLPTVTELTRLFDKYDFIESYIMMYKTNHPLIRCC